MDLWRVAKALVGHGKGLRLPTTDDDHPADPAACSSVGWLGALWLPLVFNQLLRRQRNCVGYVRSEQSRLGVGDVCFFLTMRCFNDAMFSNS